MKHTVCCIYCGADNLVPRLSGHLDMCPVSFFQKYGRGRFVEKAINEFADGYYDSAGGIKLPQSVSSVYFLGFNRYQTDCAEYSQCTIQ